MLTAGEEGFFVPGIECLFSILAPHSCTASLSAARQTQKLHPEIFGKQQLIVGVITRTYPDFLTLKK